MGSKVPEKFDYISMGSGEAGKYVAWNLSAKYGKKCAVIERKYIGGSCPNIACLPSKNILHSAEIAQHAHVAKQYGVSATNISSETDMKLVRQRKAEMVDGPDGLVNMHLGIFKARNVELIMGEGQFVAVKTVQVGDRLLTAENIVINTGSRAFVDPNIPGLIDAKPMTHVEILNAETLPSHLIIIGGGYVGMEFAQAFARFGARVTVVQRAAQPLPKEDEDVVASLQSILEDEGVTFFTSAAVESVHGVSGEGVTVRLKARKAEITLEGSHLLVATGRLPNTEGLGLDRAGVELAPPQQQQQQGRGSGSGGQSVAVDEQLRTSAPGIYAVGDCAGSPLFTHIGFDDSRVVLQDIVGNPRPGGTTGRQVPYTLFTSPELARVGLSEREARDQGVKYRLGRAPMGAFLRTRTLGDEGSAAARGFAKVLVEEDGDRILGFTALGPHAGELLPVVQLAMKLGASYEVIAEMVITHPTMNEGLVALFGSVPARSKA
ncbi:hypothetical protein BX600DRAFT_510232 [Xylariales sp. PMI_506]|nr:hypothetical protein BX600DRAFT_510232 [Xylariales sp. PMI_506]